jgi:Flp pilus assembly protein TadG
MQDAHDRKDRGSVAVEFALVLPILLLLVLGIVQYGLYFYARQGGSDIARDGARRAAVGDPPTCSAFQAGLRTSISNLAGAASSGAAVISRTYVRQDPTLVQVGDTVTVTVQFPSYDLHIPLVPFARNGIVSTTVSARVENVPTQPETCP